MKIDRLESVDLFRGFLVLGMIVYHFFFNLEYFYGFSLTGISWVLIDLLGSFVRFFFIFLVGVSSRILYLNSRNYTEYARRQFYRFFQILTASLLVTLFVPFFTNGVVWFGILHLISFLILMFAFIVKLHYFLFFLVLCILGILYLPFMQMIFGLSSVNTLMLDYFPVYPWVIPALFGFYSFGYLYKFFLKEYDRLMPNVYIFRVFGKNSLMIYLIHQPVILLSMLAIERSLRI